MTIAAIANEGAARHAGFLEEFWKRGGEVMFRTLRLLLLSLIATIAPQVSVACSYVGTRWHLGTDSQARMTLHNRESCGHDFRLYGPISLARVSIAQRPAHGVAGTNGRSSFAYKPANGYVGPDRFIVRIEGETSGSSGATNIIVEVMVTQ